MTETFFLLQYTACGFMMGVMVTFKKITTGPFDVLANGVQSGYGIINGSAGSSGNGFNMYGITRPAKPVKWIGTLQASKKIVAAWIQKGSN